MTSSRYAHSGHRDDSPLVPTGIPGVPLAPVCCVIPPWIVIVDSERIKQARQKAGLSQERLANESGVGLTTIRRLERQMQPRCHFRTRWLIATALGTHPKAITAVLTGPWGGLSLVSSGFGDTARETLPMAPGRQFGQVFTGRADQVRLVRAFVRRILVDCPVLNEAVLICSELSSNAVRHSASGRPGGSFTVRAEVRDGEYVWIGVEDQGGRWTTGKHSEERGRGLVVVDKLAVDWDVQGDDTGRVICAWLGWP